MRGISHVAIGVADMERSLHFYRDLLGLTVTLDKEEPVRGSDRLFADPEQNRRRAVYLRWADGPEAGFIVLSQKPARRQAARSRSTRSESIIFHSGTNETGTVGRCLFRHTARVGLRIETD